MKALVVANWKMNPPTLKEAKALFDETKRMTGLLRGITAVVAPPALFVRPLAEGVRKGRVAFAVQNAHFEADGAHTGEIAMQQAHDCGATYVLIGHAERRELGETNDDTRKKIAAALSVGLTPILCVGEKSREGGAEHFNFVREQLRTALADVPEKKLSKVVVVYEPLWTIGKDSTMQPRDMHEMSIFIRKVVVEKFGDAGHSLTILYGGSVDASSAPTMLRDGDVKGLLVGRASWKADTMTELLRAINDA
ncbi:MAG TPA: triose-phosphate isomerase [Candidatus Paceibacterota bacterium]|nr:triose-phosphate isomerase [Candidatus Paceibacterota bacterium]